jgi:hypothetical protein
MKPATPGGAARGSAGTARPAPKVAKATTRPPKVVKATTTTTPTGPNVPRNPRLVARLQTLLPPGTDMTLAAAGFKNQGQFIAAVHVSKNLGIPFADLKSSMVDDGLSLGQSIQVLRPGVDSTLEASRATRQARRDLQ